MRNKNAILIPLLLILVGCAPQVNYRAQLGLNDARRVAIVGENVAPSIAIYYQRKYDCPVWFTPFEGKVANAANNFLQSGLGPSVAMRALIKELKSIDGTFGRWEIIVPKIAEKYFLTALKHMETGSLSRARGTVVLIDSSGFSAIEDEVKRVTGSNFFVTYEFQKDLGK